MRFTRVERLGIVLLFLGFSALAAALWYLGLPWIGLLLPVSFVIAVLADHATGGER